MARVAVGFVWVCVLFVVVGWGVCFALVLFWFFDRAPSSPSYISYEVRKS